MKNRKQYELVEVNGKFRAAVVGSDPVKMEYLSAEDKEAALKEIEQKNTTYYLEDYAPEEIEAFWQSIDVTAVNEFFSKLLNVPVKLEKQQDTNSRGTICYGLKDKTNIAQASPVIYAAWSEMYINTFGCAINANKSNGELYFWADINLSYRHWGGGTNGATIGTAIYKNGVWDIKSERENAAR